MIDWEKFGEEYRETRQRLLRAIEDKLLSLGVTREEMNQGSRQFMYEALYGEPAPCWLPDNWSPAENE